MKIGDDKVVLVRQYRRFRFGEWEVVCQHRRSLPCRFGR